jgi:hypothetical protein
VRSPPSAPLTTPSAGHPRAATAPASLRHCVSCLRANFTQLAPTDCALCSRRPHKQPPVGTRPCLRRRGGRDFGEGPRAAERRPAAASCSARTDLRSATQLSPQMASPAPPLPLQLTSARISVATGLKWTAAEPCRSHRKLSAQAHGGRQGDASHTRGACGRTYADWYAKSLNLGAHVATSGLAWVF